MVKCLECNFENPEGSKYCCKCGNSLVEGVDNPVKKMDNLWYLVGFLIPIVGILGGIYYGHKGYQNGTRIFLFSLFFAVLNFVLVISGLL